MPSNDNKGLVVTLKSFGSSTVTTKHAKAGQSYTLPNADSISIVENANFLSKLTKVLQDPSGVINTDIVLPTSLITSYTIIKDFFRTSDVFTFELSLGEQFTNLIKTFVAGRPIQIDIDGQPQILGYIDEVDIKYDRGGTTVNISGRDKLGAVIDSSVTPDTQAKEGDTLLTALEKAFESAGFSKEDIIYTSGDEVLSKSVNTKLTVGKGTQFSTRKAFTDPTRTINRKQKPQKHESAMQYAIRLAQHSGLFINLVLKKDGNKIKEQVSLSPPVYERSPDTKYHLVHKLNSKLASNNVKSGNLKIDWSEMVSYIVFEGTSGGGNTRKQTTKTIVVNELVGYLGSDTYTDDVKEFLDKNKYTKKIIKGNNKLIDIAGTLDFLQRNNHLIRPLYIYDQESNSEAELEFYARRKMGDLQANAFQLEYEVMGHIDLWTEDSPIWSNNMMVHVDDELLEINEDFWISKVEFSQTRNGGTTTKLILQLPYIYDFGINDTGPTPPAAKRWAKITKSKAEDWDFVW